MKLRFMKFLAPDGAESGGTAVLDAPAAAPKPGSTGAEHLPALEPAGEIFNRTLEKLRVKPTQEEFDAGKEAGTSKEPAAKEKAPEVEKAPETKAAKKPGSALDAVMDQPEGDIPDATEQEEDYLKDIPETLTKGKQAEDWKRARGKIETLAGIVSTSNKRIKELEGQVQTTTGPSPELTAEIERLKKENEEYKTSMVALNIEFEPEHRKKFVEGREILVNKAAQKLDAFVPGQGKNLSEALKMPESRARTTAINACLEELDEGEKHRVRDFISQIDRLDDERAEIQKDPRQAWEQLKATDTERKLKADKDAADFKQKIYDDTKGKIGKELILLRSVDSELEGAKEHNERADAIHKEAWRLLGNITPQEAASNAYKAAATTHYQGLLVNARKEVRELSARLAEYEGSEVPFRGGKEPAKSDLEANLDKSPGQLYKDKLAELSRG